MANPGGHVIGTGIFIKGDLTGAEELTIEGSIEGTVHLKSHLIIGPNGLLVADIHGESVTVHGEVRGNITAALRIEVHESAKVVGDLRAPSIMLADGARFRGQIEMEVNLPRDL